jgi:hypothetical protein
MVNMTNWEHVMSFIKKVVHEFNKGFYIKNLKNVLFPKDSQMLIRSFIPNIR